MKGTRPSVLAGSWYEADPAALTRAVDAHIARGRPLEAVARTIPVAMIAPHAGHQWSGDAAGYDYRLLAGDPGRAIETVILIGPSHRYGFRGASVTPFAAYETPLGEVPVATSITSDLKANAGFDTLRAADAAEHCLEIQLPFLQRVLRHPFRIAPILIGQVRPEEWKGIAAAIAPHIDEHTLIVISSDFTHFGSNFGYLPFTDSVDVNLRRLDKGALEPILRNDPAALAAYLRATGISVCGINPIGILLELMNRPDVLARWGGQPPQGRVLEYYRSADITGELDGSVSYAAVSFFRAGDLLAGDDYPKRLAGLIPWGSAGGADKGQAGKGGAGAGGADVHLGCETPDSVKSTSSAVAPSCAGADSTGASSAKDLPQSKESSAQRLNDVERKYLLALARETVRQIVSERRVPKPPAYPAGASAARLEESCGVFVTLTEHEQLRGCIGSIIGTRPLVAGVIENAANSAVRDPRFPPVAAAELPDLEIEISVLTPLRAVSSYNEIEVGRHGVVLNCAGRRAVFLPQVAPEQGWDCETMLDHLALKAGLPASAWRQSDARFEVFEAFVFSE